jgi:hypothetical protein
MYTCLRCDERGLRPQGPKLKCNCKPYCVIYILKFAARVQIQKWQSRFEIRPEPCRQRYTINCGPRGGLAGQPLGQRYHLHQCWWLARIYSCQNGKLSFRSPVTRTPAPLYMMTSLYSHAYSGVTRRVSIDHLMRNRDKT